MKIKIGLFAICCLFLLASCNVIKPEPTIAMTEIYVPTEEPTSTPQPTATATPEAPKLSQDALMNSVFYAPQLQRTVQLSAGNYAETTSAGMYSVVLLPQMAFGDLNNDGFQDAAVLLAENSGGTGVFYSLIVIYSSGNSFSQSNDMYIDDRPVINSVSNVDGRIVLDAVIHGPGDAMVSPTFAVKKHYQMIDGKLILTAQTSATTEGVERNIQITAPAAGSEVSSEVQIIGNMPIAPFENNLRLRILDVKGNVLSESGFMVTAVDVGQPATFDNVIPLPVTLPGTKVLLELSELSMADGSLINMNSVIVTIK